MQAVLSREEKGRQIAENPNQIIREAERFYKVSSQSGHGMYNVTRKENSGWICDCPDHVYREVRCKHIIAVQIRTELRNKVRENVVIQPVTITVCPFCHSSNLKKFGLRHNKYGDIQRYLCADCQRTFSVNVGFERMKHNPQAITAAMQLYFSGESLRNTSRSLHLIGVEVSHQTVYNWIQKYVRLMETHLRDITPQVSDTWRADEMFLKIKGDPKYLYALMDDETRYWIAKEVAGDKMSREAADYASHLFQESKKTAGKKPLTLITDGLHAYHQAYKHEFFSLKDPRTEHVVWQGDGEDNRKMERFNCEVRGREKVMRSLKREDSPILDGYQIFHNYVRPHMALRGKTSADLAGIEVRGENKWMTLIQNASLKRTR